MTGKSAHPAGSHPLSSFTTTRRIAALATGTALAGLIAATTLAGPASADPNPGSPGTSYTGITNPAFIYAGVGADADDTLMDNVAAQYDTTVTTPSATTPLVASYDATTPGTGAIHENITTKPGCTAIPRPNGTGDGFTALGAGALSGTDNTTPCIDFNRSSSPKATGSSQLTLNFWALGQDAIDWVTVGTSYAPSTPLSDLQLREIFTCQITDWAQVGGQEGAIHVYVNPSTAGTYKYFLTAIGSSTGAVASGCGSNVTTIEQVDGSALLGDPQGIAPYAVTKWAGQSNDLAGFPDERGGTVLGHIGDSTPPVVSEPLDSTNYNVMNTSFANDGSQGRYLYNVTRDTDTIAEQTLATNLFSSTGYICQNQDALLIPYGVPPLGDTGSVTCGQES
jgi:ABC-type phosphate transport system substrate-binding protein